jgi:hypothetical protein
MESKQYAIIKFLHFRKIKAVENDKKLTLYFGETVYTLASVHDWLHKLIIGRVLIGDEP